MLNRIVTAVLLAAMLLGAGAPSCQAQVVAPIYHNDAATMLVPNSGLVTVLNINTSPVKRLFVMCKATGQALAAFQVMVAPVNNLANPVVIASVAADFSSPVAPMIRAVGAPVTLAAGAIAAFLMDTGGIDAVIVQAQSANAAGTTLACFSSAS